MSTIGVCIYWTNREASLRSLCWASWICYPRENKPACRRAFHQEGTYHDGYALFAHRTCPTKRRHCFKRVKREDLDFKIRFYNLWEEYSCLDSFQTFANCNEKKKFLHPILILIVISAVTCHVCKLSSLSCESGESRCNLLKRGVYAPERSRGIKTPWPR